MSDERALRDELEALGAHLKAARQRIADAEAAQEERVRGEASRVLALRAEREALTKQLESLARERASQREALGELRSALARARRSVPRAAYVPEEPDPTPALVRFFTDPTPHYARDASWLGKLVARYLAATGQEWK